MLSDSFFEFIPFTFESVECSLLEVQELSGAEFPNEVVHHIRLPATLQTLVFKEVVLLKEDETVKFGFPHFLEGDPWVESKWAYDTFTRALAASLSAKGVHFQLDEAPEYDDAPSTVYSVWAAFSHKIEDLKSIGETLRENIDKLRSAIRETEVTLDRGIVWQRKYELDERLFCIDVLTPLLRKMGFLSVRYTHGAREFGKDFTFSELTKFSELRHYGLQAKAGNVSGNVNSDIDEILGQIIDAFSMPYYELGSKEARYISVFVVAISGHFTVNAKEKIVEKMPKGVIGSVYFLDKERIIELIERYWSDIGFQ